jgi:hypothetical protein
LSRDVLPRQKKATAEGLAQNVSDCSDTIFEQSLRYIAVVRQAFCFMPGGFQAISIFKQIFAWNLYKSKSTN